MKYVKDYLKWSSVFEAITQYAPPAGIEIAPGVDARIDTKLQGIISAIKAEFGKPLTIQSGFRDPVRNRKVGGAAKSAHLRNTAVDLSFDKTKADTIRLIELASKYGAGGIGVYGLGNVHIDTEERRAWGKGYRRNGVPNWAEPVIQKHLTGTLSDISKELIQTPVASVAEPTEKAIGAQAGQVYTTPGDPYQYRVSGGVWWTQGPRIPEWKSLETNRRATAILDARHPDAR